MEPIISTALMTFGAGFTGAAFSKAKGPGQALDDIMTLIGFEKLHEVAEKKRAQREQNIQAFKESIAQKIIAIPEESMQEPPLAIVGPAIEASKFFIEEEELREMFANLIGSSMNTIKNMEIHPSFVEIIKQLSVLDAKILFSFGNTASHPVGRIKQILPNGYFILVDYFYLHESIKDYHLIELSKSISNLERLGLIKISDEKICEKDYFLNQGNVDSFIKPLKVHNQSIDIQCSRLDLTPFGSSFNNTCVKYE